MLQKPSLAHPILGACLFYLGLTSQPLKAADFPWIPKFELPEGQDMKTLGGMQFWGDVAYFQGYRIQHNVFFKQHRLLDPKNHRHASAFIGSPVVARMNSPWTPDSIRKS